MQTLELLVEQSKSTPEIATEIATETISETISETIPETIPDTTDVSRNWEKAIIFAVDSLRVGNISFPFPVQNEDGFSPEMEGLIAVFSILAAWEMIRIQAIEFENDPPSLATILLSFLVPLIEKFKVVAKMENEAGKD